MGLFDRLMGRPATDPEVAAREAARREESLRNLEAGRLPVNAIERLTDARRRQGTDKHFYTSNLSVNELHLAAEGGYLPLGQVMGSTVYHVGYQWNRANWGNAGLWGGGSSYELQVLTDAYRNARSLAFGRLAQEAALLGATGVLGVRLTRKRHEWGSDLLEFMAVGTAIRERDLPPPADGAPSHPLFLSDLSGQDVWALRRGGFRPVGIAAGNCTYYQIPSWNTQRAVGGGLFTSWTNQELPDYTQALYQARELAMDRLVREARAAGASGVVGATTEVAADPIEVDTGNNSRRTDMLYHFTALGTAIAPLNDGAVALPVVTTVTLADPPSGGVAL